MSSSCAGLSFLGRSMHKIFGSMFIKNFVTHGAILCVTGDLRMEQNACQMYRKLTLETREF